MVDDVLVKTEAASPDSDATAFVNEHCPYSELGKEDRHALRDVLRTAFSIGKSSHALWTDFLDTTAFTRRDVGGTTDLPRGIVAGAIVMSYPAEQYDYLAYIAVHPDYRYRRRLFGRSTGPHHGTELLRYVYETMRDRVTPDWMQTSLMIEPFSDEAFSFYLRALPSNEYLLRISEEDRIISVSYDGLVL